MTHPLLHAEKICYSYNGENPTLKDISFSLYEGESLGVLGPNGGGKSTLMKIIAGLILPDSGEIFFEGKKSSDFKTYPYEKFSYVPQHSELNSILPVKVSEYMDFAKSLYKNISQNEIDELLNLVGIFHKKDSLISKLSGGEKQRVLLARALLNKPKLLLLDEPTKGLDSNGQDQLLTIIEKIKTRDHSAVMIVDHNINQIIRNCHKILCLNRTYHWHDHRDLLTKNILEDIYHCEFEHLLIHENDLQNKSEHSYSDHHFCNHDHTHHPGAHSYIRGKKS
ncbi:MAG: metal ABC transporter ATP-binding protein [Bacteriovorax sp.]|nr:metal ABC transporter ATP-binding protein [Bacteriovorax sp.]